jgi:SAM-dependent methyltransferase
VIHAGSSTERTSRPPGSTDGGPGELRGQLRGMWAAVAASWGEQAAYLDARGAAVGQLMLELSDPQPGERVLELACGPGGLGLAAAERVAPGGHVVLSDVVVEMTSVAAARAAALGLGNVSTRELDLERIDQPDGSYDVVLCREGLMLVPDPARAAREILRILRPGGRVALAVWGPRDRNPWLGVMFDAVSAQVGAPIPPPGVPGPFSLGDAVVLAGLLDDAGLSDVTVREVSVPLRAASFEEWWSRGSTLAGPLARRLASLPSDAFEAIQARARAAIGVYEAQGGLEIPGVALLADGRRADASPT